MYFIPRNNAIYNYIAHTSSMRRYLATLFVGIIFTGICFYGIYIPLGAHIVLYKAEALRLQKQYEEIGQLDKSGSELLSLIDTGKKNSAAHVVGDDKREEYCNKRMQFVLDTVTKLGLTLNAYGSCKEKDKDWYTKDSAHYQITGTVEKLLSFLKTMKDSAYMITFSQVAITRMKDNLFQLSCDLGIVRVRK
jgi:hypothetical protein